MFSWIIQAKAKILEKKGGDFTVENHFNEPLEIGESIAHDWACMTITSWDKEKYSFFVMEESLDKTNLWEKDTNHYFNVERSLKLSDAVNGHLVTGHIDSTGNVIKIVTHDDESVEIFVEFDSKFKNYIIDKWSVTINGVSLTVCANWDNFVSVSIIPHTQEVTNLGLLEVGNRVNLEFDMIGKYINKIYGNK